MDKTLNPWNNECELCYGRHKFKVGDWMFKVEHPYASDGPIIVCQVCLFRNSDEMKVIDKQQFTG